MHHLATSVFLKSFVCLDGGNMKTFESLEVFFALNTTTGTNTYV